MGGRDHGEDGGDVAEDRQSQGPQRGGKPCGEGKSIEEDDERKCEAGRGRCGAGPAAEEDGDIDQVRAEERGQTGDKEAIAAGEQHIAEGGEKQAEGEQRPSGSPRRGGEERDGKALESDFERKRRRVRTEKIGETGGCREPDSDSGPGGTHVL